MNTPIKDFSIHELEQALKDASLPKFRSHQILEWLYNHHAKSFEEMSTLPKNMREQLASLYPLHNLELAGRQVSKDATRKYLFRLYDGALIESVGLPSSDGRLTACISSQSGCAMNCSFCATGKNGLTRNLSPGEFVDQIKHIEDDFNQRVTNIVVMGQGEPFANYDNLVAALQIINNPKYLNIGARHITVSTCGMLDGIERFSNEKEQYTLAISLHAAQQDVRDKLMPAMRKQPLPKLRETLKRYIAKTNRRVTFEYALMLDTNDSMDDLKALIDYCSGLLCHVNLIPLNEIDGSEYRPVSRATVREWNDTLQKNGIASSIRLSRGSDIAAACGQLASKAS